MKRYLTTTAIAVALSAGTAFAGPNSDIDQTLLNLQDALNDISAGNSTGITQDATNAGNLVSWDGELDEISQGAFALQSAYNVFDAGFYGFVADITQTATNIVNSVSASTDGGELDVSSINQVAYTPQTALNDIYISQHLESGSQAATNAANLVNVDDVQGDGMPAIDAYQDWWSTQYASNWAIDTNDGNASSFIVDLIQAATNVANSINAGDDLDGGIFQWATGWQWAENLMVSSDDDSYIAEVEQTATNVANSISTANIGAFSSNLTEQAFDGVLQEATNDIVFGDSQFVCCSGVSGPEDLGLSDATQVALNAGNIISVTDSLNVQVIQDATGEQWALNTAVYAGPAALPSKVWDTTQDATNVVNSLSTPSMPNISGVTDVTQVSSVLQVANNVLSGGQMSTIAQTATNVANSVSMP